MGVEERVPTELTLIGCSFAAAGGLRLSPRTSSLRLQNFTVLDLSLASTDWSGVERLELRHVRQLLGLDADTFRPMAALRELLVENVPPYLYFVHLPHPPSSYDLIVRP